MKIPNLSGILGPHEGHRVEIRKSKTETTLECLDCPETILATPIPVSFEELDENLQEVVMNQIAEFNTSHEWWDSYDEVFRQRGEENYGLHPAGRMFFDLDRGAYITFQHMSMDPRVFIRKALKRGTKFTRQEIRYLLNGDFNFRKVGRDGQLVLEVGYNALGDVEVSNDVLSDFLNECLSSLQKEYEFLTGEKGIREQIKENGMMFDPVTGEIIW